MSTSRGKVLVADIGGTNARFALVEDGGCELTHLQEFPCKDFNNVDVAVQHYLQQVGAVSLNRVCLALPGPVDSDEITLANSHWAFSQKALASTLGSPLKCINDFDAQAYYVDQVPEHELQWLNAQRPQGNQVKLVMGPGTGLGVSAILPTGELVPSEGGHLAFAPCNTHEMALLEVLWRKYSRVSVERLLSGPGLANLYWANCQLQGIDSELIAAEVVAAAEQGNTQAIASIKDFLQILASVAGDLTLAMGAFGGVYLSGGVLPRLMKYFDEQEFNQRFAAKGRFQQHCQATPIALVQAEQPGLRGCALAK